MKAKASTAQLDAAIKLAQSAPDLVARVATLDPDLATNIEATLAGRAKTQWGRILVAGIGYVAMKYGFGWDQTVDELVAGAVLVVGHFVANGALGAWRWLAALRKIEKL